MRLWRQRLLAACLVGATVVGLAACGSSNTSTKGGSTSNGAASGNKLTVDILAPNPNFAPVFVAKAAGLFAKQGLNVTILENTATSTLPLLVSGKADLTLFSFPNPLIMAMQGKPTTVFLNGLRDSGAALVGTKTVKTLADLRSRPRCRITTTAEGTQAYGYAVEYTKIPKLGLQKCTVQSASSNDVAISRLSTGQVDAAVLPLPFVVTVLDKIGAHLLISPNAPDYRQSLGLPNFISSEYFGLSSTVQAKRPLMVKFIRAITDTNRLLVPSKIPQLAKYLQQFNSFKNVPLKSLETSLTFIVPYMGPGANYASPSAVKANPNAVTSSPGYIPQSAWQTSLQQISKWGIANYSPSAPTNAYDKRVDMSLLEDALRK